MFDIARDMLICFPVRVGLLQQLVILANHEEGSMQ